MQSLFVSSLLAVGAFSAPTPEAAAPLKVSLPKRSLLSLNNGNVNAAAYLGKLNYTIQKYTKKSMKSYGGGYSDVLKRQK